jgi:hypothetical protein
MYCNTGCSYEYLSYLSIAIAILLSVLVGSSTLHSQILPRLFVSDNIGGVDTLLPTELLNYRSLDAEVEQE